MPDNFLENQDILSQLKPAFFAWKAGVELKKQGIDIDQMEASGGH